MTEGADPPSRGKEFSLSATDPHIAVIGAGITGVTTAYSLIRRGCRVTLFEKHPYAAMETSFANGGQLSRQTPRFGTAGQQF